MTTGEPKIRDGRQECQVHSSAAEASADPHASSAPVVPPGPHASSAPNGSAAGLGRTCKRATDVVLSASALIILCPAMLAIALAIVLDSPGPALFRQKRVGRHGDLFEILKFRTMRVDTPDVATDLMLKLERSPITRVGAVLRKTSLDELPQLINVLRGDMSLVGPRPALYNQYELTEKRQAAGVLAMPPGITGWAQVNGRDELADDVKVEYDAWYCQNWNYWLDWHILARTVGYVLGRRGAV